MDFVRFYSEKELSKLTSSRAGEEKMGAAVKTVTNWEELKNTQSK